MITVAGTMIPLICGIFIGWYLKSAHYLFIVRRIIKTYQEPVNVADFIPEP